MPPPPPALRDFNLGVDRGAGGSCSVAPAPFPPRLRSRSPPLRHTPIPSFPPPSGNLPAPPPTPAPTPSSRAPARRARPLSPLRHTRAALSVIPALAAGISTCAAPTPLPAPTPSPSPQRPLSVVPDLIWNPNPTLCAAPDPRAIRRPCSRAARGLVQPTTAVWAPDQVWGDGAWGGGILGMGVGCWWRRDTRGKRGYDGGGGAGISTCAARSPASPPAVPRAPRLADQAPEQGAPA